MKRGTLIILNAIATAPYWSYTQGDDPQWGNLSIGANDEPGVDMKVYSEDYERALKLLYICRHVPLEKINEFWDTHVNGNSQTDTQ